MFALMNLVPVAAASAPMPVPPPSPTPDKPVIAPKPIPAPEAASRTASPAGDLSMAEARRTFGESFDIVFDAASDKISAFGMIHNECVSKFSFSNSENDPEIRSNAVAGLRIRDTGAGRSCMEKHKDACGPASKDENKNCTRISKLPGSSFDLRKSGKVKIGLIRKSLADRDAPEVESVVAGRPVVVHVTAQERAERIQTQAREERRRSIDLLRRQVDKCRTNDEETTIARSSLQQLVAMQAISERDAKIKASSIDDSELNNFAKRISKASDSDLDQIREDVTRWLAEKSSDTSVIPDKAAKLYYLIAKRIIENGNRSPESMKLAKEAIKEAIALSGISKTQKSILESYVRQLEVDHLGALARGGMYNNPSFWPAYANLMNRVQNEAMTLCSGASPSMEGCMGAINAARTVAAMPQHAQQADQQRAAVYQQIQQAMMQPLTTNGAAPAAQTGTNPLGTGVYWAGGQYGALSGSGMPQLFR